MNWETAGDFLKKFASIKPPAQFLDETVRSCVFDNARIALPEDAVRLRGGVVYIRWLHPTERSEIALNKSLIISALNKELSQKITDIRF